MTKEEAIAFGKRVIDLGFKGETQAFCELAIKALEQQPYENVISQKIDEFEIKEKPAEIWIVKGKLQIRYLGVIHNIPLSLVTPPLCKDCISREEALMALTGDITDCTIEEYITKLREKLNKLPAKLN